MLPHLIPTRTEPKCVICKLDPDRRATVEEWLSRRIRGEEEGGEKITWELLVARLPMLIGRTLSDSAMKRHVRSHTRLVGEGEEAPDVTDEGVAVEADAQVLLDELDELLESGNVSATGVLNVQLRAWLIDTRRRLARGERLSLTADQAHRAATALVSAERQRGATELLSVAADGLGRAFQQALGTPPRELPEVIEVEAVEVEE